MNGDISPFKGEERTATSTLQLQDALSTGGVEEIQGALDEAVDAGIADDALETVRPTLAREVAKIISKRDALLRTSGPANLLLNAEPFSVQKIPQDMFDLHGEEVTSIEILQEKLPAFTVRICPTQSRRT